MFFFFFEQKTAYEMRISDWSSDVCSSDLERDAGDKPGAGQAKGLALVIGVDDPVRLAEPDDNGLLGFRNHEQGRAEHQQQREESAQPQERTPHDRLDHCCASFVRRCTSDRSEEHTSELQSLMRISYAVFCL